MVESYCDEKIVNDTEGLEGPIGRTMVISFPAALRKALVHRTLRGLRFILLITRQTSGVATRPLSGDLLEVLVASESWSESN